MRVPLMVRRTGNSRVIRHLAARARAKQSTTELELPVPSADAPAAQGGGVALASDARANARNSLVSTLAACQVGQTRDPG
jgi:hypothetical protein